MKRANQMYLYVPPISYGIKDLLILIGISCAHFARNYCRKYGGSPLIFRVNLRDKSLKKSRIFNPIEDYRNGKILRQVVIKPPAVKVDSFWKIRRSYGAVMTLLEKISEQEIEIMREEDRGIER